MKMVVVTYCQTPKGKIHLFCSTKEIKVKAGQGTGTLRFKSQTNPVCKSTEIRLAGEKQQEMTILNGQEYVVKYKNVE